MVGIEPRSSQLLAKCTAPELPLNPLPYLVYGWVVGYKVSCSPGWPPYAAEYDLEPLSLLHPPPCLVLGLQSQPQQASRDAGHQVLGLSHARQSTLPPGLCSLTYPSLLPPFHLKAQSH